MSPEQAGADEYGDDSGRSARATVKTDSWTFGTTLAHLLTGKMPWLTEVTEEGGRGQKWIERRLRGWKVPSFSLPPSVPPKLAELVQLCLKANPEDRPAFHEICEKLENIITGSSSAPAQRAAPTLSVLPSTTGAPSQPLVCRWCKAWRAHGGRAVRGWEWPSRLRLGELPSRASTHKQHGQHVRLGT